MAKATIQKFPRFANFVKEDIPLVPKQKSDVWQAFLSHSKLPSGDAKAALAWGDGPLLLTGDLGSANGFFDPTAPNTITLSSDVTSRFEADFELPKAQLLVESTILHEMIHWSYKKLGLAEPDNTEIGRDFELESYGADIDRYWLFLPRLQKNRVPS